MEGTWRDLFAQVYRYGAIVGIAPQAFDDAEIWEVAAMLGQNEPPDGEETSDWNAARAYALEHGLEEPSWDDVPVTPADNPTAIPFLAEGLIAPPEGAF